MKVYIYKVGQTKQGESVPKEIIQQHPNPDVKGNDWIMIEGDPQVIYDAATIRIGELTDTEKQVKWEVSVLSKVVGKIDLDDVFAKVEFEKKFLAAVQTEAYNELHRFDKQVELG